MKVFFCSPSILKNTAFSGDSQSFTFRSQLRSMLKTQIPRVLPGQVQEPSLLTPRWNWYKWSTETPPIVKEKNLWEQVKNKEQFGLRAGQLGSMHLKGPHRSILQDDKSGPRWLFILILVLAVASGDLSNRQWEKGHSTHQAGSEPRQFESLSSLVFS